MQKSPICGPAAGEGRTGFGASEASRLHTEASVYCMRAQYAVAPSLNTPTAPRGEQYAPSPTTAALGSCGVGAASEVEGVADEAGGEDGSGEDDVGDDVADSVAAFSGAASSSDEHAPASRAADASAAATASCGRRTGGARRVVVVVVIAHNSLLGSRLGALTDDGPSIVTHLHRPGVEMRRPWDDGPHV